MPRLLPMLLRSSLLGLLAGLAPPLWAADDAALFSAEGYRLSQYRSPTPTSAEHATTLDTAALQQLLQRQPHARLIDVYRRQWLHGQFIEDEVHANLPASLWLANTGDGRLEPMWQVYFASNLQRVSQGDPHWPLVFYCRSDCWLGWNAVKRAHALGYDNLYWYRDGIDAWEQAGLPLQRAQPQEFP
ncbi:PQQ-dependent catabolism-associated CXXCW motif protein [Pseudomonas cavernicola]|uniref:PQQ-dependent catabolism-associated CXXCW motif protein n=1 Tax=Pseudomonas cavernicola TaxID=2320866 RepID=A0A418X852_9PSED|nr:PQQ-dependent catabolism-associated CXXCW motif protein [Pseudomonas cavernicola]RJG08676.1 PQQ-dependent catabolism-associated CXXCW motif protein [Pseudomonas cavernicola]